MIERVHHLTFVVPDLATAVSRWEADFGIACTGREDLPERGVVCARCRLGDLWIVLVQPVGEGIPAQALRDRGPGLLLVSLQVEDLEEAIVRLKTRGVEVKGLRRLGLDGWWVQDLDSVAVPGATMQLCQEDSAPEGRASPGLRLP